MILTFNPCTDMMCQISDNEDKQLGAGCIKGYIEKRGHHSHHQKLGATNIYGVWANSNNVTWVRGHALEQVYYSSHFESNVSISLNCVEDQTNATLNQTGGELVF